MRKNAAFSLIELLVVIAILAILLVLTAPALTSSYSSMKLTQGAQVLVDQITLARQLAPSKNRTIETRIYKFRDTSLGQKETAYRAIQNFELLDDGSAKAVDRMRRLPEGVILDGSSQLSNLLAVGRDKTWTSNDTKISLPQVGTTYDTRVIRFRPDGSTDLAAGQQWFLTLHQAIKGTDLNALPEDFFVLQIDPWTGRAHGYRP